MGAPFQNVENKHLKAHLTAGEKEMCFLETALSMTEREVNKSRVVDVVIYRKRGRDSRTKRTSRSRRYAFLPAEEAAASVIY
jgi:hypothetical protein